MSQSTSEAKVTETKIPMLDIGAQNGPLMDELRAAFDRVATKGHFILGPEVSAFEEEIAEHIGVAHAVGVSSGTDALLVALMAHDIGPGDEVITTPFSFFATAGCIHRVGATPVFVDIDPVTFNIDPAKVGAAITERTKAILPVHLFGQPCDHAGLAAAAGALPIIEDAAQALGASTAHGPVGGLGTFGCFSFFPSKNLGAFGDGGLVTTDDADLADLAKVIRGHGAKPKYFHARIGGNFRLDALQAALLRVKRPHLPAWTEARRANAARYDALFADLALEGLTTPARVEEGHVYNQYVIRARDRDALQKHLGEGGISTAIYYPRPLHRQACFEHLGYGPGSLPVAEKAAEEVLALPIFSELGEARQRRVVDTVAAFYAA